MTWWRTGGELLKPHASLGETYDFQQNAILKFEMFAILGNCNSEMILLFRGLHKTRGNGSSSLGASFASGRFATTFPKQCAASTAPQRNAAQRQVAGKRGPPAPAHVAQRKMGRKSARPASAPVAQRNMGGGVARDNVRKIGAHALNVYQTRN